jgi:hypothetical protein
MADKARHAFGNSANLQSALDSGAIDAYDILFLDGDTEPKVGWVDKNGVVRLVEDKVQIVRVDELPVADGDENVVYIYNNEGYVWDGAQCVPITKSADLSTLETQVTELSAQLEQKVDAEAVKAMIEEQTESAYEIIEF